MEVALDARISARHLSFVETGRSHPGRELLLRLLGALAIPAREQNQLLLSVGHAPAFPERALDHPDLEPVKRALDLILRRHEPYPAIVVDRHWNLLAANTAMTALAATATVAPAVLGPPLNAIRTGLHPDGLAIELLFPPIKQRQRRSRNPLSRAGRGADPGR
jgi:transcriptional regulator with XRE-family HTH domain